MNSATQRIYYKDAPLSKTLFKVYKDIILVEWSRKCQRMRLKTEDNCCVHTLLFAHDEVVVSRGAEDCNYIRENWKKNMRTGDFNNGETEYLLVGTDHSENLQINGNTIRTVKRFK
jgi:hypothetical protein